ncbi:trace amine-associated receptor 1-like [Orbicella faveolata]|uniref:trace amine-associated receptor 1-like n=1 Tax=Orbicella faveolata TaxID=48498 RepID=UPI0009E2ADFC|nr:trace amine-associated receptor 1-like [Orbicella faveolata]
MYNNSNQSNNPTWGGESYAAFYDAVCVLNVVFSLTAFAGNFLVLGAIWSKPTLHKPTNILLLGLSLSDLAVGLIVQPLFIVVLIYEVSREKYPVLRLIFRSIQAFFVSATILTLTSVSVDRCLALILHLRYVAVVTVKKTILVLCLIWLASVVYAVTFLIDNELRRPVSFFVVTLCIVINTSTCSTIYRICRRHRIQIQNQSLPNQAEVFDMKRYRKSLITMIVLLMLLIICYTPYICVRALIAFTDWPISPRRIFMLRWSAFLVYLNSSINPLVYCWRIPAMRVAIKQFWKSLLHRHST